MMSIFFLNIPFYQENYENIPSSLCDVGVLGLMTLDINWNLIVNIVAGQNTFVDEIEWFPWKCFMLYGKVFENAGKILKYY